MSKNAGAERWVGVEFRVKADGRVGSCIRILRATRVAHGAGNTRSRRNSDPHRRPSAKKLVLSFPDGAIGEFDKYALTRNK